MRFCVTPSTFKPSQIRREHLKTGFIGGLAINGVLRSLVGGMLVEGLLKAIKEADTKHRIRLPEERHGLRVVLGKLGPGANS